MRSPEKDICAIYVDMGTTNTRGWLMRGDQILAQATELAGVRDTARVGSSAHIRAALRKVIAEVRKQDIATHVVAAGMIGSPLGLVEVPHITAPAGITELAVGVRWLHDPEVTDLPILLVPGIRSGGLDVAPDQIHEMDVMRGEETLCAGLIALGLVKAPAIVLNLGSHWKAIRINDDGQVEFSVTSLSGELVHATQTQTILASSVPRERPSTIAIAWMRAGMAEARRSGLPRALFCVRLLELAAQGTPEERFSFLIGAFVAADLDALVSRGILGNNIRVTIIGGAAVAEAWQNALTERSISADVFAPAEAEKALLAGLRCILVHSCQNV